VLWDRWFAAAAESAVTIYSSTEVQAVSRDVSRWANAASYPAILACRAAAVYVSGL